MHLVFGQQMVEADQVMSPLRYNYPGEKHRASNKTQRFEPGPAPVHKLSHFGMCVTNFAKVYEFDTSRFNVKASDLNHDENSHLVTAFMHLDRSKELVDHHCFFFFEGPQAHVHHSSFETHDFDTRLLESRPPLATSKGVSELLGRRSAHHGKPDLRLLYDRFDPSGFILESRI